MFWVLMLILLLHTEEHSTECADSLSEFSLLTYFSDPLLLIPLVFFTSPILELCRLSKHVFGGGGVGMILPQISKFNIATS